MAQFKLILMSQFTKVNEDRCLCCNKEVKKLKEPYNENYDGGVILAEKFDNIFLNTKIDIQMQTKFTTHSCSQSLLAWPHIKEILEICILG